MTMRTEILSFFIAGTVCGSFIACVSDRMIKGEDWKRGRSRCDHCGHVLSAGELIPVISYLRQKGRCRHCGKRIPWSCPAAEVLCGAAFSMLYLSRGSTDLMLVRNLILAVLLCGISLTDMKTYLIPDGFQAAAVLCWFVSVLSAENRTGLIEEGIAGGFLTWLSVALCAYAMKRIMKTETIGEGDLILYAVCGLYTGWFRGQLMMLFSCLAGLVPALLFRPRRIPFAPCISAACIAVLCFGDPVMKIFSPGF